LRKAHLRVNLRYAMKNSTNPRTIRAVPTPDPRRGACGMATIAPPAITAIRPIAVRMMARVFFRLVVFVGSLI